MPDAVELLRAANPVSIEELLADPDEVRRKDEALRLILATAPFEPRVPSPAPARPRRRLVVAIAIAIIAMLAAAAAWLATREPVRQSLSVACFKEANLQGDPVIVRVENGDAVGTCGNRWRKGEVGPASSPPLQECVLKTGAPAVFPNADHDLCIGLGLSLPDIAPSGTSGFSRDAERLQEALVARFHNQPCKNEVESRQAIREELDREGLTGWRIELVMPFSELGRCGSFSVDEDKRTVFLAPLPDTP